MRGCVTILGILVVVVALATAAVFFLLMRTPDSASQLAEVKPSTEAVASLDQKIAEVEKAVASAQKESKPVPMTLRVTEEELTSKAAHWLEQSADSSAFQVRDPQIHLLPGEIVSTGRVNWNGLDSPLVVTAQVRVQGGKPEVAVQSVELGGLPVPGSVKDQIVDMIHEQMTALWAGLPIQIQDIRLEQGSATITGVAIPK